MNRRQCNRSFVALNRPRDAVVRVVFFPSAGSSATQFIALGRTLPPRVEGVAVEYAGHGRRWTEPLATSVHQMADDLAGDLAASALPLCFFGHSMGSLVAFETAHRLARDGGSTPAFLIASAHRAPRTLHSGPSLRDQSDSALIGQLAALNGTVPDVLNDLELMELMLPLFRADLHADETYVPSTDAKLAIPISGYLGAYDPFVSETEMDLWATETSAPFKKRRLLGDHFYFQSRPEMLIDPLIEDIFLHLMQRGLLG